MTTAAASIKSDPPSISVSPTEKRKYEMMWEHPEYRNVSPGELSAKSFIDIAHPKQGSTVIDFGCGTGRGSLMLAIFGMDVTMLDFASNCLDDDVRDALVSQSHVMQFVEQDLAKPISVSAQYGYCTDVMEHIPPTQVDKVLRNVLTSAQHVFFQISCTDDACGALIGHPLHLSVHDYAWWLAKFREHDAHIHWSAESEGGEYCFFYVTAWADGGDVAKSGKLNSTNEQVLANVKANLEAGWDQVVPHETNDIEVMILCGGPSLAQFEDDIRRRREGGMPLITLNGTYNWCLERGIRPSAQIVVDSREFNKRFVQPQVDTCRYLIASQCHPALLEGLPKDRTLLWHTGVTPEVEALLDQHYQGRWYPVPGGSTVMLRAIPLMRMLGYRKFHVYGFDSCLSGDTHHAYAQAENDHDLTVPACVGDRVFQCHGWMVSQAQEFMYLVRFMGDEVELEVYGDGLIAHILNTGAVMEET